jgi:prepilin-type N-terminal cleavage/methylation domain-containing protein
VAGKKGENTMKKRIQKYLAGEREGFSLVELIIVIAIMAILVGVVGTQVIPYLERSRKAKDEQIISGWNSAAVSSYTAEASALDSKEEYVITVADGSLTIVGTNDGASAKGLTQLKNSFFELSGLSTSGYDFDGIMASKAGKDIKDVIITIDGETGKVETKIENNNATKYSFETIENK